ncbi:MAG: thioredoxin domain-containing protein [Chloroflexi bacterium]|nr:thioredoxin domain-containing protein [Chloroflexota bacterium]
MAEPAKTTKPPKVVAAQKIAAKKKAQKKQQQQLLLIGGAVVGIIIIAVAAIYLTQKDATKVCGIADTNCFSAYAGIPLSADLQSQAERDDDGVKLASDVVEGVERGMTADGIPYIGSPSAPIVFAEFSDFSCPHCAEYEPEVERIIRDFVRTGQARFEYYPMTFVGGAFSAKATDAAVCAGQQGAFWEFHSQLFDLAQSEGRESFTTSRLVELGDSMNLDTDKLRSCINSNYGQQVRAAASELQTTLGVNSTPTVVYRQGQSQSNGDWKFFVGSDGQKATRGSYDEVAALVRQFNTPASDTGQ